MAAQMNTIAVCAFCPASLEVVGNDESAKATVNTWAAEHAHEHVDVAEIAGTEEPFCGLCELGKQHMPVPPHTPVVEGHATHCTCDRCY